MDPCDDDMGDDACDKVYEYDDNDGDYKGFDNSHKQESYVNMSYYYRGEYEEKW